jgi:CSLREA domain-containing protein
MGLATTTAVAVSLLVFAPAVFADPTVHTGPATGLAGGSATLNGDTVTPVGGGSVSFEYGATVAYGSATVAAPVAGGGDAAVSATVSGLVAGTVYHYRLDVTVGGITTFGGDRTFTADGTTADAAPTCDPVSLAATAGSASSAAPSCSDADGDLLSFAISGAASHGTASIAGGQLSYTPASGYTGADSFTYTASDGAASSAPATVTVTVTAAPAVPPTIASLLPATGVAGSSFTVNGTGFTGTTSVTIGGVSATFTVGAATGITVTVPSGAASGFVAVTNPAGTATSLGPFLVLPSGSFAHVFTVDSSGDGADASAGDGSCNDGTGHCTLRAAIQEANAASGHDLIAFAVANSGVQTITPASALPAVTDPVTIDGTTEPGFTSGHPVVELSGASTGVGAVDGLAVSSTVRGLVINRFHGWAIHLSGSGGDTIAGNFVGTTPDGMSIAGPSGQASDGVFVDGVGGNTIGGVSGTTPGTACAGDCNLISPGYLAGGHGNAIQVTGAGASGNTIEGNFLGTNCVGTALSNVGALDGVSLSGASGTTIGGTTASARNLIGNIGFYGVLIHQSPNTTVEGNWLGVDPSGQNGVPITQQTINDDGTSTGVVIGGLTSTPGSAPGNVVGASLTGGIRVAGNGTLVEGNLIGTNASGTGPIGSPYGVSVEGPAIVGGSDPGARNVISGNRDAGVYVYTNATIQGNSIGTNPAGTAAVPNSVGIEIGSQYSGAVSNVTVTGNLISGQALQTGTYLSSADGLMIMGGGTNETITGNLIGVGADGTSPLGNGGAGVNAVSVGLSSPIGGAASSAWNTIAFNGGAGIKGSAVVLGNSIHDNGGLGIDNSVSQANGKITIGHIVSSGSSSTVTGTLNSAAANNAYLVQLYVSPSCDPSGFGEGQTPIGTFTLTPTARYVAVLRPRGTSRRASSRAAR